MTEQAKAKPTAGAMRGFVGATKTDRQHECRALNNRRLGLEISVGLAWAQASGPDLPPGTPQRPGQLAMHGDERDEERKVDEAA